MPARIRITVGANIPASGSSGCGAGVLVGCGVDVGAGVLVGCGVLVGTGVLVGFGVPVAVGVAVGPGVAVAVGVAVGPGVPVGVIVAVGVGVCVVVGVGLAMEKDKVQAGTTASSAASGTFWGTVGATGSRVRSFHTVNKTATTKITVKSKITMVHRFFLSQFIIPPIS